MSDMLKQAIIDAATLKEVATKNAEETIIEKYSYKIREAVDKLLEIDDEENQPDIGINDNPPDQGVGAFSDTGAAQIGAAGEMGGGQPSELGKDVPLAATDGKKLCLCPADEEEIEINFDDLERQMGQEHPDETDKIERDQIVDTIPDETEELDESELEKILEELKVDLKPVPSGNAGDNLVQREINKEDALAMEQSEEYKKENDTLKKEKVEYEDKIEETEKELNEKKEENKKLNESLNKYKELLIGLKNRLDEVNLDNAKLLYTNKILTNGSLNERQRSKIVESLGGVKSVEEAKIVFETLQRTVGSAISSAPKSLREATSRQSTASPLYASRQTEQPKSDPQLDRIQKLAGIRK